MVVTDDLKSPRARSTSHVRFNPRVEAHSPEETRRSKPEDRYSDTEVADDRKRRHRRRKKRDSKHSSGDLMNDKYERPPSGSHYADDDDGYGSDGTIEMPRRFDKHGNKIGEGDDALQNLLGGLASRFFSGGGDDDSRGGRRRHRH